MRIDIITVLPELLKSPFEGSIMKRAIEKELVEVHFHNLRDYTTNKQKSVDDYQYGGGAGMVLGVMLLSRAKWLFSEARSFCDVVLRHSVVEGTSKWMMSFILRKIIIVIFYFR